MVGVGPASADFVEGISEVGVEESVDDVVGGGIEVAGDDGWCAGEGGFLIEDAEGVGELDLAEAAILTVFLPAFAAEKAKVGGSGLEVDVEELEIATIGHLDGEELAPVFGDFDFIVDGAAHDDGTAFCSVITIVAIAIEEVVDELFEVIGVRDFLEKNDVGLEAADGFGGVGAAGAVQGDDTEDFAAEVSLGRAVSEGGDTEAAEGAGFIRDEKNGKGPNEDREEGEPCPEKDEAENAEKKSDGTPDPDGEDGECGKADRETNIEDNREEVQGQGEAKQDHWHGVPWATVNHRGGKKRGGKDLRRSGGL